MDKRDYDKLAPLVKDKWAWDAFNLLLDMEKERIIKTLAGAPSTEELHRIVGKLAMIDQLRRAKENAERADRLG